MHYYLPYNISLYNLTTHLFIGFTTGKTLNIGTQKWLQIHAYHWLQIPQISGFCYSRLQVGLPVDYQSAFIRSLVGHLTPTSTSCWLTFDLLSISLPCRTLPRLFDFDFTHFDYLDLRLVVDLPRPRPLTCCRSTSTSTISRFTSTRLSLQRI
jgi:hypothetical protein